MATRTDSDPETRLPLTKERVLMAAVAVADRGGIEALTMRRLAEELGVEAMSLYYHVANKEAVLDGVVDVLLGEIETDSVHKAQAAGQDWKTAMRAKILTARTVMLRHPWAPGVLESRTNMSPSIIIYFESILGIFVDGGFSYELAHHAMHALGSRALGFAQELFAPDDTTADDADEEANQMMAQMADQLPHLFGMLAEVAHDDPDSTLGWCDDQTEFEFGLDLMLDGLERRRAAG